MDRLCVRFFFSFSFLPLPVSFKHFRPIQPETCCPWYVHGGGWKMAKWGGSTGRCALRLLCMKFHVRVLAVKWWRDPIVTSSTELVSSSTGSHAYCRESRGKKWGHGPALNKEVLAFSGWSSRSFGSVKLYFLPFASLQDLFPLRWHT